MKHLTTLTTLLLLALTATAQDGKVPVMLQQRLDMAPEIIHVIGNRQVDVVLDTVSYILAQTYRQSGEASVQTLPEGQLQLSGDGRILTVPRNYPVDPIIVHTAATSLTLNANSRAYVTLATHDGQPASLHNLRLTASSANIWVRSTLEANEAVLSAENFGHIAYGTLHSPHLEKNATSGGSIVCMDCTAEKPHTDKEKQGLSVVRLMLNHDLPMFASLSVGATGWAGAPFGGMTGTFGHVGGHRFSMGVNPTGYFAFQFGVNILTRRHWNLGVGFGMMEQRFTAENARIDIDGNHIIRADLPSYYSSQQFLYDHQPGDITWSSSLKTNYMYIPLRAEWRLHSNYRGLRVGAQLMPGMVINKSSATLVRQVSYPDWAGNPDAGLIEVEITPVKRYLNRFQCDLRIDVGLSNISLFVQTSLVPLFDYQTIWQAVVLPPDQYTAIDEGVFPMSVGCSINL